jgi:aryl-alcohol dehydrogenase-like predicted oxidoreductase
VQVTGATKEGTARFAADAIRGNVVVEHFRETEGLQFSTIGLGTYLGDSDDATDESYRHAIVEAAKRGCNVFDAASNYRCQRSERALGEALRELANDGIAREQVVVASKGGYVAFDGEPPADPASYVRERFLEPSIFAREDIAAGTHVLTPSFLKDQIAQSRENLGVDTIDIYYLHNPEAQLASVSPDVFESRLRAAIECLEEAVTDGSIGSYGAATWNAFRVAPESKDFVSLADVVAMARDVGGDGHHFRFVQAPYNLAMTESFTTQSQSVDGEDQSLCQAAESLGVHLLSSASLDHGRLTHGLPDWLGTLFKGFATDAQRSLQFVRSTPGFTSALVGMKSVEHVRENLSVAEVPPARMEEFLKLFEVDASEA